MPVSSSVAVVLAVKRLDAAKSRLAAVVPDDRRRGLVAAMLADTLGAVEEAGFAAVTVVTPDPRVAEVVAEFGARTLDEPARGDLSPLNAALLHGIDDVRPTADLVAALQADLAALDAPALTEAIDAAAAVIARGADAAFVADRSGAGTALLVVRASAAFTPRFGPDSAAAHREAGAVELDPAHRRWARLRTDVDTPDDLSVAVELGLGPRTRDALDSVADIARSDTDGVFLRR
nr:2-phospho-L-lactate guanylyltransferase [Gordonia phthalatica]